MAWYSKLGCSHPRAHSSAAVSCPNHSQSILENQVLDLDVISPAPSIHQRRGPSLCAAHIGLLRPTGSACGIEFSSSNPCSVGISLPQPPPVLLVLLCFFLACSSLCHREFSFLFLAFSFGSTPADPVNPEFGRLHPSIHPSFPSMDGCRPRYPCFWNTRSHQNNNVSMVRQMCRHIPKRADEIRIPVPKEPRPTTCVSAVILHPSTDFRRRCAELHRE